MDITLLVPFCIVLGTKSWSTGKMHLLVPGKINSRLTICQNKNESSSRCLRAYPNALSITLYFFSCSLGKMQILENFVLRTCTFIADVRISIYVQQEVNILLSKQLLVNFLSKG